MNNKLITKCPSSMFTVKIQMLNITRQFPLNVRTLLCHPFQHAGRRGRCLTKILSQKLALNPRITNILHRCFLMKNKCSTIRFNLHNVLILSNIPDGGSVNPFVHRQTAYKDINKLSFHHYQTSTNLTFHQHQ